MRAAHVALFNQRTQVGQALGCPCLLVFGAHGSVNLFFDQNVKDVDGQEHVLVGKQNNSRYYIDFNCYSDPNIIFLGLHLTDGLANGQLMYFKMKKGLLCSS